MKQKNEDSISRIGMYIFFLMLFITVLALVHISSLSIFQKDDNYLFLKIYAK